MILPEDIEKQRFEVTFRGYNTTEVNEFMNKLIFELGEMAKEQETLRKRVAAAELIAKDAKDREEEFVASMQADRDSADAALAHARTEGERIIREASNAAAGIMAEVRRRAGEISAESRRASAGITDEARRNAAAILEAAKNEAEQKLYSARVEADNIVKAAETEARALETEARSNSAAMAERAERSAALCEEYMNEIRTSADLLCRELDAELKNSAARITLLGRRIAAMNITPPPVEEDASPEGSAPTEESAPTGEPAPAPEQKESRAPAEAPRKADAPAAPAGGYFTKEYKQVMEELFGKDVDITETPFPEDDDTYDYFDKVSVVTAAQSEAAGETDPEDEDDSDAVTSEYTGIPTTADDDLLDVFSNSTLDKVYKSPSDEDINNILNDF